jgi:hypothetical protein
MTINNKHNIGDIVYLITDEQQRQRIVTGIVIRPTAVMYHLACGDDESGHYDIEISTTKNILI